MVLNQAERGDLTGKLRFARATRRIVRLGHALSIPAPFFALHLAFPLPYLQLLL